MTIPAKTLIGHIPALVARRFAANPGLIIEPIFQPCSVAILSVNVTDLAERLMDHGPAGSEELTLLLKTHYEKITDVCTKHGGDVVKFTGDILLVLWTPETADETLTNTTLRAAQCALEMQQALSPIYPFR